MPSEKPQPIIKVYDPEQQVEDAIAKIRKQQNLIIWAMVAVVMVVAVGFVTIVIAAFAIFTDHQDYAAQRYNKYIELLEKQEQKIQQDVADSQKPNSKTTK